MKFRKSKLGVYIYNGKKFTYAYYKDRNKCKLLIETIAIPPAEIISIVFKIKDIRTAKRIIELLETEK